MKEKDSSKIPKGFYCYKENVTTRKGEVKVVGRCPYYSYVKDQGMEIPFCKYLEKGGLDHEQMTPEQFNKLKLKYNSKEKVFKKYPLDLLFDMVKHCNKNII